MITRILFFLFFSSQIIAQNTGIYEKSDTVASNVQATVLNSALIGKPAATYPTEAAGTYIHINTLAEGLNLISQGRVNIGDPDGKGLSPAFMQIDSDAGGIYCAADNDVTFEIDSFKVFVLKSNGAMQFPQNAANLPMLLGDRGSIWYDLTSDRFMVWRGSRQDTIAFQSDVQRVNIIDNQLVIAENDADAALKNVPIGQLYELSAANTYGLPEGILKRRKN